MKKQYSLALMTENHEFSNHMELLANKLGLDLLHVVSIVELEVVLENLKVDAVLLQFPESLMPLNSGSAFEQCRPFISLKPDHQKLGVLFSKTPPDSLRDALALENIWVFDPGRMDGNTLKMWLGLEELVVGSLS